MLDGDPGREGADPGGLLLAARDGAILVDFSWRPAPGVGPLAQLGATEASEAWGRWGRAKAWGRCGRAEPGAIGETGSLATGTRIGSISIQGVDSDEEDGRRGRGQRRRPEKN
jgi:hypothetical protein